MILRQVLPFLLVLLVLVFSGPANADCANPPGVEGENLYNADYKTMQFCDGTTWWAMKSGGGLPACAEGDTIMLTSTGWGCTAAGSGCTAPASCPNVGDVCTDGSQFAGFMLYGGDSCEPLYVTDDNQSLSSEWKNATGTDDISTDDMIDGQVNHTNRVGTLSDFPAFDLCESNTYHGKGDWYLPARAEFNLLWLNKSAIDANAAGAFSTSTYWTSSEYGASGAWYQVPTTGIQRDGAKTSLFDVRCVRRD